MDNKLDNKLEIPPRDPRRIRKDVVIQLKDGKQITLAFNWYGEHDSESWACAMSNEMMKDLQDLLSQNT